MEKQKRPTQIQIYLPKSEMARLRAVVTEHGFESMNIFCKSIILQYLNNEIIGAEMSADAQNVARTMAALAERVESLAQAAEARQTEIVERLATVSKKVDAAASDTFGQLARLTNISAKVDQKADSLVRMFAEIASPPEDATHGEH